jgi:hypothetical protein
MADQRYHVGCRRLNHGPVKEGSHQADHCQSPFSRQQTADEHGAQRDPQLSPQVGDQIGHPPHWSKQRDPATDQQRELVQVRVQVRSCETIPAFRIHRNSAKLQRGSTEANAA